jgi:hypothetical protein
MENKSRRAGSLVAGSVLVVFGALALVAELTKSFSFWSTFWPFILVGIGVIFFVGMFAGGKSTAGLAIPGAVFVGIGLMMFIQNLTSHWESWSYAWTVIIMFVGVGITIMGMWARDEHQRRAGLRVLNIGVVMFVIFGAFFEMMFNNAPYAQIFFPIALIALGGYLVVVRSGMLGHRESEVPAPTTSKKVIKK